MVQTNKIVQLVLLALLMLLSMMAVSTLLELRDSARNVILGAGCFVILLLVLWRRVPVDAKLMLLVILGYALGGKGFAYVSPFEPIYIGEITLALCILCMLSRPKQLGLFDTPIHGLIWIYVLYAGIHLIVDFETYRLLAIRDSSMAYYALFFVASYSLFHNENVTRAFEKTVRCAIAFSTLSILYHVSKIGIKFPGFSPHTDAFIPLCVGSVLYLLVLGMERKKLHYIVLAGALSLMVIMTKTAALVALAVVVATAVLYGRINRLIMPALILGALCIIGLAVIAFIDTDIAINLLLGGEAAEAVGIQSGEFVGFSGTTQWRWLWWTIIWNDTMQMAPFWGQGFGSDITGPFLVAWLGPEYGDPTGYARYPHNIMVTVLGRLGFIGVAIFGMLFVATGRFVIRFCRSYFSSPARRDADLFCYGVIVAGMINGVLQSTYEIPHGAITHWICLGYLAKRYYRPELQGGNQEPEPDRVDT